MNPKQDRLFNASLLALITIYTVLTQLASLTGGVGLPHIELPIDPIQPADVSGYTVYITEVDGESIAGGLTLDSLLTEQAIKQSGTLTRLVNRLGIAYYADELSEVDTLRAEFETVAFANFDSVEYQLILRVVNPVEKYSLESYVSEEILATFEFSQPFLEANTMWVK